jgi:hypothetical protein
MVTQHKLTHFQWIEVIVHSRPHNDEDVTDLTFNDVRNGIPVAPTIHSYLESRRVAFLKASTFATVTTMKLTLSFFVDTKSCAEYRRHSNER